MIGAVNGHAKPPTATPAVAAVELGEVLSPSQVGTFVECPAQWYFKYLVGLEDPATSALALGTAFHAALGANFEQKIETGRDLSVVEVAAAFTGSWRDQCEQVEFREDESADELWSTGCRMVEHYMDHAAPAIMPLAVERHVTGEIGGVKVQGYVDLVDENGVVVDFKTASKKPGPIKGDHRLQLTTYSLLTPECRGQARLDTVVKTKKMQLVQQSTEITPADVQYAETMYPSVQQAIRDGVFYPRRSSWRCSRKNCPFWRACQREFGGTVE